MIHLFLLLSIAVLSVYGATDLGYCDNPRTYCVQVNASIPCSKCNSQNVTDVLTMIEGNMASDPTGNYTILLVGSEDDLSEHVESLIIDVSSSGRWDPLNMSVIQPYPGHSIRWKNEPSLEYIIRIEQDLWKITGGDGYLEFVCDDVAGVMINIYISTKATSVILENLVMKNYIDLLGAMISVYSPINLLSGKYRGDLRGVVIKDNIFEDTGSRARKTITLNAPCGDSCFDNGFVTDLFSEEKRIWITGNKFLSAVKDCHIAGSVHHLIEGNYFRSSNYMTNQEYACMIDIDWEDYAENVTIRNNVFHFPYFAAQQAGQVVRISNYHPMSEIGYVMGSHHLFHNNLILDESGGKLSRLLFWSSSSGGPCQPPPAFHVYNNIINSTSSCISLFHCSDQCDDSKDTAHVVYQYNRMSGPGCETSDWISHDGTCDLVNILYSSKGNNSIGKVSFNGTGDTPFPAYDLVEDIVGLGRSEDIPDFPIAPQDYNGRPVPGDDMLARSSLGPFQFQCPSRCLGVEGRVDCQTQQCSCVDPYFGTKSCEYTFDAGSCPTCENGGTCAANWDTEDYYCVCPDGYYGDTCKVTTCFEEFSNTTGACGIHGTCSNIDVCQCGPDYYGTHCNTTTCFGIFSNLTTLSCGEFGTCTQWDHCECDSRHYGVFCNLTTCSNVLSNLTSSVCSGHGTCESYDTCLCSNTTKYSGPYCEFHTCYGWMNNDTSNVCSGHGNCTDENICECRDDYLHSTSPTQKDCSTWKCFGEWHNSTQACNTHGICESPDGCGCFTNYTLKSDCGEWKCFDELRTDTERVCGGHGTCLSHDKCKCTSEDYLGSNCDIYTCFNISRDDIETVCNGHGVCQAVDSCKCSNHYDSSSESSPCDSWRCFGVHKDVTKSVCSQRGVCVGANLCTCTGKYLGENCETWNCGKDKRDIGTCSGHGTCNAPNDCDCDSLYDGELCENSKVVELVVVPVASSAAGITGLVIISAVCLCLGCTVCACLMVAGFVFVLCVGLNCLGICVFSQRFKLKKFGKLRNIDILLDEQRIEDDVSIAHINMNKKLFEIEFNEIKILKLLGEGGSNSTVYLANWKGKEIAFKCFKTRLVCSSQDSFEEFEREVKVFSSVSHPNICAFYGATMKPPRVGILMELCSNGECFEFIDNYLKDKQRRYPMKERLRMICEVAAAMDYLHSRKIVHRDLKCENVLVDRMESCKLMDFGLSKISERLSQQKTKRVGTSLYMAPEVVSGSLDYNEKCDVFSFGIMIWVMITGDDKPYGGHSEFNIELKVAQSPDFRPKTKAMEKYLGSDEFWVIETAQMCWQHDPQDRPSFENVLNVFVKKDNESIISDTKSTEDKELLIEKEVAKSDDEEEENDNKEERIRKLEMKNRKLEEKLEKALKRIKELEN